MSTPATTIEPELGRSSPATSPRRVDLPLPDGPVIPQTSPAATSSVIPSRIVRAHPPLGSRMTTSRPRIITKLILHWAHEPSRRTRTVHRGALALELRREGGARGARDRRARGPPARAL